MSCEHPSSDPPAADVIDALMDGAARVGRRTDSGAARVRPALRELAGGLEDLAQEGLDAARQRAARAQQAGAGYIRGRPLPALLMAATAGAALVLIGSWLLRPNRDDRRDR